MSRSVKKNPYRKSRRFDPSCRCHGSCPHCQSDRFGKDRQIIKDKVASQQDDSPSDYYDTFIDGSGR
jgi:hypothetical protein